MSFLRVLLGTLVGGLISTGAIIGITFLGTMVPWWALLLIGAGGCLIGGFVAGLLARGAGKGALAGLLSGLIVFLGVFLFVWFYYEAQVLAMIADLGSIPGVIDELLNMLGLAGTAPGDLITQWLNDNATNITEFENFVDSNFVYLALILGGIFGGLAAVVNFIAGLIGGLFTRKKEDEYDSYY